MKAFENFPYKIVLGSKSPRRKDLLSQLELVFETRSADVDETILEEIKSSDASEWLARVKAEALRSSMAENELIITADTLVILKKEVLGKPNDKEGAKEMLRQLSGKKHKVITGVCLLSKDFMKSFSEETEVKFNDLSDDEIDHYVEKYQPMDKAGAYGIQEWIGLMGVRKIEGCFFNVIGLPVPRLYRELKKLM